MPLNTKAPAAELKQGRRKFLLGFSWTGISLLVTTLLAAVLKYFWPPVSSRPLQSVQVGFPEDYRPGQVVYHRGRKLFILRDYEGFFIPFSPLYPPGLSGGLEQGSSHVFMPMPRGKI